MIKILLALCGLAVFALTVGPQSLVISYPLSDAMYNLIFQIRLPRIIGAIAIGAGLATAGAAYQSAFKNPIVSPSILGVTHGAGIGAALCMLLGHSELISMGAVVFGLLTVFLVWQIAKVLSKDNAHLVVIGVIISGVAASVLSLIKFLADPTGVLPAITFWLMGSLTALRITHFDYLVLIVLVTVLFYKARWRLDLLAQPSSVVRSLGVDERYNIGIVILGATVIAAFSASVSGVIGMVGLAIPHLVRMLQNTDEYRTTLLNIQISGAAFLLATDTIIRMLPIELPVGILTSLFGALIFGVALCRRLRRK